MLPKKFEDLHNIHSGKNIVVCGCGVSLLDFKEHHKDFITIGVNDVPALFNPTYNLITDHPNRFNDDRKKIINEGNYKHLLTCVGGWRHNSIVHFELGNKGAANLDNPKLIDHFLNSPYTACNAAYKLGAKNIGLIGVDFTDGHFYSPKDGPHSLARMRYLPDLLWAYNHLRESLDDRGIGLYNLNEKSQLCEVMPYISIDEFKKL